MSEIKIWHNPRCRKSREGLKYLQEKGIEPKIIDYMKGDFSPAELEAAIKKAGLSVDEIIRKKEKDYKELGLKNKELSLKEFAELVKQYPKLLERPLVESPKGVVLARPAEKIEEIL
ncbi:MAG: arsenate reductase (glutaredoxin) [Calditrichia bacterium]